MSLRRGIELILLETFIVFVSAFNIDSQVPFIKEGPKNTYFGFSVSYRRLSAAVAALPAALSGVIVGAPLASSVDIPDFVNTGAIYSCPADSVSSCTEFDYPSTNADLDPNLKENKTNWWLGVSVSSGELDGPVYACGHRYRVYDAEALYTLGLCLKYTGRALDEVQIVEPCSRKSILMEDANYGICQAGSSVFCTNDNAILGMPGAKTWSGSVFLETDLFSIFKEAPGLRSNTYFGSSTYLAKNLTGDGSQLAIVGAPRLLDIGQVHILAQVKKSFGQPTLETVYNFTGDQFGSAFGHAVLAVDFRGNNNPSLIISAPYYRGRNIGGAIYIYINDGNGIDGTTEPVKILSRQMTDRDCAELHCEDAAFGYALANIGDINGDGFRDIAVGAPYEGNGAVYIYLGREKGLHANYSQRIAADDIAGTPTTFGISISGLINPENKEGYDGIIVGAYKADKVVILRSRPVVHSRLRISANLMDIDPTTSSCKYTPSVTMVCFQFRVCFNLTSDRQVSSSRVSYKVIGDVSEARPSRRRVQFDANSDPTQSSELSATLLVSMLGFETCKEHTAYIREVRELLKPISIYVEYDLNVTKPSSANVSFLTYPVIDWLSVRSSQLDFQFKKNCATVDCRTDIMLSIHFVNPQIVSDDSTNTTYVFNSGEIDLVSLSVEASVKKDSSISPAYESVVYIDIPPTLLFESYERVGLDLPVSCSANSSRVTCVLPKILESGTSVVFFIKMKLNGLGYIPSTVAVSVNMSNTDSNGTDNFKTIALRQVIKTDLVIFGTSEIPQGGQVFYNDGVKGSRAIQFLEEIGELVQHTYTISNNGSGDVERLRVTAEWPYETKGGISSGKYLLYMVSDPILEDNEGNRMPCVFDRQKVNPEAYLASPKQSTTTYLPEPTLKPRARRAVTEASKEGSGAPAEKHKRKVVLDCRQETASCFNITCDLVNFKKKSIRVLRLNARLWGATLFEDYGQDVDIVEIYSRATLYVDPLLNIEQPTFNDAANASTKAEPSIKAPVVEQVAWWIIVVAVGVGLLILIIIVILFWKCGFFQRHRPMMHEGKVEKKKNEKDYKYDPVPLAEK